MGIELILPYILPIIAANLGGVASWIGSKRGNGEKFNKRKQIRTLVTGVITMIAAYVAGVEPTDANLTKVAIQYGFIIQFVDSVMAKYLFKRLGLTDSGKK